MAVGQGGYYTNNLTIALDAQIAPNMLIAVDTQNPAGSPQQTFAVPIGMVGTCVEIGTLGATAFAGGGQASATLLKFGVNTVTTVATAADSVKLPPAIAGRTAFIRNLTATATTVFGSGTDTINGVATATGVSQAANTGIWYLATTGTGDGVAGTWVRTT